MSRFVQCRVVVLQGGPSAERTVSLATGAAVAQALNDLGHTVIELDPDQTIAQALQVAEPDVVFNALHGTFGEDGRIQGLLDWLQIPYTGEGVRASALAFDKSVAKSIYRAHGVPVADDLVIHAHGQDPIPNFEIPLALPLVVKPIAQGSSVGVHLVHDDAGLKQALRETIYADCLVESLIAGPEFSVVCAGQTVLGSVEIEAVREFYDFEAKYGDGGTRYHVPPRLSQHDLDAVEEAGMAAHRALGCRAITRTDVILGKDGPVVLETNTLPGMTANSLVPKVAAHRGMSFQDLIQTILDLAQYEGQQ